MCAHIYLFVTTNINSFFDFFSRLRKLVCVMISLETTSPHITHVNGWFYFTG